MEKRITNIDALRGIAALMVVLCHASASTLPWVKVLYINEILTYGAFGVQVFFVISGYIIPYSLEKSNYAIKHFGKFLFKRFVRINIPAYILIIVYLAIEVLVWMKNGQFLIKSNPFASEVLLSNFLMLAQFFDSEWYIGPYWTLEIEFQFYILISMLFPLLVSKNKWLIYIGLLIFFCFRFIPEKFVLTTSVDYFLIGILLFLYRQSRIQLTEFLKVIGITSIALIYYEAYIGLFVAICSAVVIFWNKSVSNKLLLYFGKISYSLYIVHFFLFMFLDVILQKTGLSYLHESLHAKLLLMLLYTTLSVWCSTLFYNYVELPFLNLSKKINWK